MSTFISLASVLNILLHFSNEMVDLKLKVNFNFLYYTFNDEKRITGLLAKAMIIDLHFLIHLSHIFPKICIILNYLIALIRLILY
jgi:hypothetical protein